MNTSLFKSLMARNNDTQAELAKALGISLSNLNAKINGKAASFRQNEITAITKRYGLTADVIMEVFFCHAIV